MRSGTQQQRQHDDRQPEQAAAGKNGAGASRDLTWPILGSVVAVCALTTVLLPQAFRAFSDARDGSESGASAATPGVTVAAPAPAAGRDSAPRLLPSGSAATNAAAAADPFAAVAGRVDEATLREIYTSYVAADRKATADLVAATASGSSLPAGFANRVHERHKAPLCRRFGLTRAELEAIADHGERHAWPKPR